jgi:hypothetical protein
VLLLGGGTAGVVVGIALSAAFAGAADAAPPPTPVTLATPALGPATTAGRAITAPARHALEAVSSVVAATASPAAPVIDTVHHVTQPLTTTVHNLAGAPLGTLTASLPATSLGTSMAPPSTQVGTTPVTVTIDSPGMASPLAPTAVPHPGSPGPAGPAGPSPVHSHRSQIPPLTANETAGYSSQSQGANPFGALPPTSLLLPVLVLGAMLLAREKTPLRVFDLRYSPPG